MFGFLEVGAAVFVRIWGEAEHALETEKNRSRQETAGTFQEIPSVYCCLPHMDVLLSTNFYSLSSFFNLPNSRNLCLAEFASAVHNIIFQDAVADAPDKEFFVRRAEGVVAVMARDIAHVSVMNAFLTGDLPGHGQCPDRCGRQVFELMLGPETREVKRHIRPQVVDDPAAEFSDVLFLVVPGGHNQIGQFHPHALFSHGDVTVQNRLQLGRTHFLIILFRDAFQVHIGGIDVRAELQERLLFNLARPYPPI